MPLDVIHANGCKSKDEGKDQESIQSSTTSYPRHHMGKSQKQKKHQTQASQEASHFSAGDQRAARLQETNTALW